MKIGSSAIDGPEAPLREADSWNQGFDCVSRRKEIGIADALCRGAIPAGLENRLSSTRREVPYDGKQCTFCILAQLSRPRDLTALPAPRSCDAGNRKPERFGSCRMHSGPQGWPSGEH